MIVECENLELGSFVGLFEGFIYLLVPLLHQFDCGTCNDANVNLIPFGFDGFGGLG